MVKYGLLLLIIGLSEQGRAALVPPSFPPYCYSEMENEGLKKGEKKEMRSERKKHPRRCRCCDAGSTGK